MSDVREDYEAMKQHTQERKDVRRNENLEYLSLHNIDWTWIDRLSDHILINGEIDYYLGKTYWFNRKTNKKGYAMLNRLLKEVTS